MLSTATAPCQPSPLAAVVPLPPPHPATAGGPGRAGRQHLGREGLWGLWGHTPRGPVPALCLPGGLPESPALWSLEAPPACPFHWEWVSRQPWGPGARPPEARASMEPLQGWAARADGTPCTRLLAPGAPAVAPASSVSSCQTGLPDPQGGGSHRLRLEHSPPCRHPQRACRACLTWGATRPPGLELYP